MTAAYEQLALALWSESAAPSVPKSWKATAHAVKLIRREQLDMDERWELLAVCCALALGEVPGAVA